MTFLQSIEIKNKIGITKLIDDKIFQVLIVPNIENERNEYLVDYRIYKFDNDKYSIKYSKDKRFKIYAIWTDGVSFLGKELKD